MSNAAGSRASLSYIAEVTHGTTPATPAMKALRCTSRDINLTKNTMKSAEVRTDRNAVRTRQGFNQITGTIGAELSLTAYDDFLAALLGGAWTAGTAVSGISLQATVTTNVYTRASGDFGADGYKIGDIIIVAGFTNAANNGLKRIVTVGTTTITVNEALATETVASGGSINLQGKRLDVGTTFTTFTIERLFADISQYQVLRGVMIKTAALKITPDQIVGLTMTMLGMTAGAFSGTSLGTSPGSSVAAPTNDPMSAFEGAIFEGAATIAVVTDVDLTIDTGRALSMVVGSKTSPDVFDGSLTVTGTMTALFTDATLYNKFINETASSLWIRLNDLNGTDFISIVIPGLTYTAGGINPPQEGPILIQMPFTAGYNATAGTTIRIQRSNAS